MPILKTKNYRDFEIDGQSVPYSCLDRVLPNDEVVSGGKNSKIWTFVKRADHPPLVGILDCLNKVRYGFTAKNVPIYLFTPMNPAYPPFRVGSTIDPSQNYLIVIKHESWDLGSAMPRGVLVESIGPVGDYEAESKALYWLYSPWTAYSKKMESIENPSIDIEDRIDMRDGNWQTFNVDPAGCQDIDDVFSYKRSIQSSDFEEILCDSDYDTDSSCEEALYYSIGYAQRQKFKEERRQLREKEQVFDCAITIADVAELIVEGGPIDMIARKAGQSLYQDGRKPRHMLPTVFAEEYGSLAPNTDRIGITMFFTACLEKKTISEVWFRETVIRNQKSYTYDDVVKTAHAPILQTLCQMLTPTADATDSHNWIAALMIFYNKEFAKQIYGYKAGILRSHSAPAINRIKELEAINPELAFLAFSAANYVSATDTDTSHYGLDTNLYTHATSPLRRYADIQNQRVMKKIIRYLPEDEARKDLLPLLNTASKAAKNHDRDYTWLTALFSTDEKEITAQIVELKQKDQTVRVNAWVPLWKRMIKLSFASLGGEGEGEVVVISKDEKSTHTLKKGQPIRVAFSYDPAKPRWKERMIFKLL